MALRTMRERVCQTLALEAGAVLVIAPVGAALSGTALAEGMALLLALSLAMMAFSPLYCLVFDLAEARLTGRRASDRPQALRLAHAAGHEVGAMLVTVPLIVAMTGHGLAQALVIDVGLSLAYAAWAWLFFLVWDRLMPLPA